MNEETTLYILSALLCIVSIINMICSTITYSKVDKMLKEYRRGL